MKIKIMHSGQVSKRPWSCCASSPQVAQVALTLSYGQCDLIVYISRAPFLIETLENLYGEDLQRAKIRRKKLKIGKWSAKRTKGDWLTFAFAFCFYETTPVFIAD